MIIKRIIVGDLETNCYLLIKNNTCLIVDPGDEEEKILENIGDLKVEGILLTHSHFDHIKAIPFLENKYNVKCNKKVDSFNYEVINTPGHTSDSKTFYFPEDKVMFTGDFLFQNSFGRTDLGGNNEDMLKSLELIKNYPLETTIYPGHGNSTNLQKEIKNFVIYQKYLKKDF